MSDQVSFELLEHLSSSLVTLIEPDFGFLHELYLHRVLKDSEKQEVCAKDTVYKRNEHLMTILRRKSSVLGQDFLSALEKTDQKHVSNWIQNPRSEWLVIFNYNSNVFALYCLIIY